MPNLVVTDQIANTVRDLKAEGNSDATVALALGVSLQYLRKTAEVDARLRQALEDGEAEDVQQVVTALRDNALKGNLGAQQFYLKNRDSENWTDRQDGAPSGGVQIVISTGIPAPDNAPVVRVEGGATTPPKAERAEVNVIDNDTGSLL